MNTGDKGAGAAPEVPEVPDRDVGKCKRVSQRERRRPRRMVEPSTRKSCDMCHVQKRKCEGDGKGICRRCARLGHHEHCVYSSRTRRIRKRGDPPVSTDAVSTSLSSTGTTTAAAASIVSMPQALSEKQEPDGGDEAGMVARRFLHGAQMVKRFRLSASTATGLVGMQENVLLKDFFSCLGFLPLTSQSVIREAIVRILDPFASSCPSPLAREGEQGAAKRLEGPRFSEEQGATAGNELVPCGDVSSVIVPGGSCSSDLSVCTFWCAVALGGLVQGRPVESVERYFRMARDGLKTFSGSPTIELAQAWTMLAHAYGFLGDMMGFQECLKRARVSLRIAQKGASSTALPMGLVEILEHVEKDDRHTGTASSAEVDGFCRRELRPRHIQAAATEGEMFLFHMRSYDLLEQTMYRSSTGGPPDENGASWSLGPDAIAELLHECFAPFERLEYAVDSRPHIQEGIGGVMINSMLMMAKMVKNDAIAARERLTRVIDVLTRYPGLCRFLIGEHPAHLIAAGLATIDDPVSRRLYARLREAYNNVAGCAGNREPLPPFDEWAGIPACCDYFACRAMGSFLAEGRLSLTSSSSTSFPAAAGTRTTHVAALGETQSDHFPSTTTADDETTSESISNTSPAGSTSALLQAEGAGEEALLRYVRRSVGGLSSEPTELTELQGASSGQDLALTVSPNAPCVGASPSLATALLLNEVSEVPDEQETGHPLSSLCSVHIPRVFAGPRSRPLGGNDDGNISERQIGVIGVETELDTALECEGAELETAHSGGAAFSAERALTDYEEPSVRPRDVGGDGGGQINLSGAETGLDAELSPGDALGTPNWLDVTHAML